MLIVLFKSQYHISKRCLYDRSLLLIFCVQIVLNIQIQIVIHLWESQ